MSADNLPLYQVALHEIGHALGLDHYTAGPAIMNPMAGTPDLTGSDIDGIQALYGAPAPETAGSVAITRAGQTVTASLNDVFENNHQASTTFIFGQGYGHDVINGFKVAGQDHDVLGLLSGDFHSVRDVLSHTTDASAGAMIHDAVTGDTIQLSGVSKLALAHHRADIIVHVLARISIESEPGRGRARSVRAWVTGGHPLNDPFSWPCTLSWPRPKRSSRPEQQALTGFSTMSDVESPCLFG